jgi:hypothetical protein
MGILLAIVDFRAFSKKYKMWSDNETISDCIDYNPRAFFFA